MASLEGPNIQSSADDSFLKASLLKGKARMAGNDVLLSLSEEGLTWTANPENSKGKKQNAKSKNKKSQEGLLQWCDVLGAKETRASGENKTDSAFLLHFIDEQENNYLRHKVVALTVYEGSMQQWLSAINQHCLSVFGRPKKLFVVINPVGGNHKAAQIYQKSVAPFFKLAGCETTVVTTERYRHAVEIAENHDFSSYDGIITVGGDGTYQEVLQGYMKQLQKAAGVDINDRNAQLVYPKIPFCLIPAGTSNGLAGFTNKGVRDPETSALRILKGETNKVNMLMVYDPHRFVGVCGLAFVVGFFTDIMKRTEELRWMRKTRYPYAIVTGLLKKRRKTDLQLEYFFRNTVDDETVKEAGANCIPKSVCVTHDSEGKLYNMIMMGIMSVQNYGDHSVTNPMCHGGQLNIDVGVSTMNIVKHARACHKGKMLKPISNLTVVDDVEAIHVKILRDGTEDPATLSNSQARDRELEHHFYFDGEIMRIEDLDIHVKFHPSAIPMFSVKPDLV